MYKCQNYFTVALHRLEELHKLAACCLEQILEAAAYKTGAVRPLTSHLENYPRKVSHSCWVLVMKSGRTQSDILRWIPTNRRTSVCQPEKILHSSVMHGHRMPSGELAGSDGRKSRMTRLEYPCRRHAFLWLLLLLKMMMMINIHWSCAYVYGKVEPL